MYPNILIVCLISYIHRGVNKVLVILGRHAAFGTPCRSHLQGSSSTLFFGCLPLKMEKIKPHQTSLINYKSVLRNISEERRPHSKIISYTIVMRATSESCELFSEKCFIVFSELICRCYFISLLTVQPETSIYIKHRIM